MQTCTNLAHTGHRKCMLFHKFIVSSSSKILLNAICGYTEYTPALDRNWTERQNDIKLLSSSLTLLPLLESLVSAGSELSQCMAELKSVLRFRSVWTTAALVMDLSGSFLFSSSIPTLSELVLLFQRCSCF